MHGGPANSRHPNAAMSAVFPSPLAAPRRARRYRQYGGRVVSVQHAGQYSYHRNRKSFWSVRRRNGRPYQSPSAKIRLS
jgi:hypothetical protein